MELLIVDDDGIFRKSLEHSLSRQGHQVQTAIHAAEAQRLIKGHCFDGMVCDVNMPGLDGVGLVQLLRRNGFRPPIVVVSASTDPEVRNQALEAGASDYFSKPVHPGRLASSLCRKSGPVKRYSR